MLKVALTGSIAMGKSTTAKMFADLGCPVFDADAAVHRIYSRGGAAVPVVAKLFPDAIVDDQVDRQMLSTLVLKDPQALHRLEQAVHPLVREQEHQFIDNARKDGHKFVILDIPLLFETGGDKRADLIVVVTASLETQRERALARPDMTEDKLADILKRQLPDSEKRARADFIVDTGQGIEEAFAQVQKIVDELRIKVQT